MPLIKRAEFSLDRFERIPLALQPTPLERLDRLSRVLGGPEIWFKREDCTGLGLGGNKARKLEYLLAAALADGADTLITTGGPQSNHARQTAAAAARCGIRCILVLIDSVPGRAAPYHHSGNLLLGRLFGAEIHIEPSGTDAAAAMDAVAGRCRADGRKPYVIPSGGSAPIGILGHIRMAHELLAQSDAQGLSFSHLVVASGSGGTHAGLAIGLAAAGIRAPVIGYCVSRSADEQRSKVALLVEQTCAKLGIQPPLAPADLVFADGVLGAGYGQPTPAMRAAVDLVAAQEGIALDPVYTGKAMAGLIDGIRAGQFGHGDRIAFVHTGGAMALFAYPELFEATKCEAI